MSRALQTNEVSSLEHIGPIDKSEPHKVPKVIKKVVKPQNPIGNKPDDAVRVKIVKKKNILETVMPKAKSSINKDKKKKRSKGKKHPKVKYVPRKELIRTDYCIPHQAICRLVKEIVQESKDDLRFQASAMLALHDIAEAFVGRYLEKADEVREIEGGGRVTLMVRDLKVVNALENPPHATSTEMLDYLNVGKGGKRGLKRSRLPAPVIIPTVVATT
jgi:histone H3/H4